MENEAPPLSQNFPTSSSAHPPSKTLHLRLLRHCVLCVRKFSSNSLNAATPSSTTTTTSAKVTTPGKETVNDNLRVVPKAVVPPDFLETFNLIWPHLQKITPSELNLDEIISGRRPFLPSSSLDITFERLPSLCQFCADEILTVRKLQEAVKGQVRVLRNIITESKIGGKYSWRRSELEDELKNSVGENEFSPTLEFLDGLGDTPCPPATEDRSLGDLHSTVAASSAVIQSVLANLGAYGRSNREETNMESADSIKTEPDDLQADTVDYHTELLASSISAQDISCREETHLGVTVGAPDVGGCGYDDDDDDDDDRNEDFGSQSDQDTGTDRSDESSDTESEITSENENCTGATKVVKVRKKAVHPVTPFPCPAEGCSAIFHRLGGLTHHQRQLHPDLYGIFSCVCGKCFTKERNLRIHQGNCSAVNKADKGTIKQKCDLCGNRVLFTEILEHLTGHVGDYVLKCTQPSCVYHFSNTAALQRHLYNVHSFRRQQTKDQPDYACDTCQFRTPNRQKLHGHVSRAHERAIEKPFECPLKPCSKRFCVRQSVDLHLATHTLRPVTIQKCDQCSVHVPIADMASHLREQHDVQEIISCLNCPRVYSSRAALVTHMFLHRYEDLVCDICRGETPYSRHVDLLRHYILAHQVPCIQYSCEHCGKLFHTKRHFAIHRKKCNRIVAAFPPEDEPSDTPTTKSSKPYSCDTCFGEAAAFPTENALIAHQIRVHGAEPFTCSTCHKQFRYLAHLSRHQKKVHDGITPISHFPCEVAGCGKVLTSRRNRVLHMAGLHNQGKTFICDVCGKRLVTASLLRDHREKDHLGLRPYVCDICEEAFKSPYALKVHRFIHSTERPFLCTICGQGFRQKGVLAKHMRSHDERGAEFKPKGPMNQTRKRKCQS